MLIPLSAEMIGLNNDGIVNDLADPSVHPGVMLQFIVEEDVVIGIYSESRFFEIRDSAIHEHEKGHPYHTAAEKVLNHFGTRLIDKKIDLDLKNAINIDAI